MLGTLVGTMNKQLRLLAFFSSGLLFTTGGVLIACSSDDTVTTADAGGDTGTDSPVGADTGAAAGAGCHDSIECLPGNYCAPDAAAPGGDGGVVGNCATLVAQDASCANPTNDFALAEESCSWRVSGQPNNHCTFYDPLTQGIND